MPRFVSLLKRVDDPPAFTAFGVSLESAGKKTISPPLNDLFSSYHSPSGGSVTPEQGVAVPRGNYLIDIDLD